MQGVLIGSDCKTEWLLPWWWKYYSKYNDLPVAVADFGLSPKMVKWCQKRFQVISCSQCFVHPKRAVSKHLAKQWQETYKGDVWQAREAWFKKPLACLAAPFDLTLWLDVDCEVCGSLEPLFEGFEKKTELALVRESHDYNSGVLLFWKKAPFLKKWAELCKDNDKYLGDQNVLTQLIVEGRIRIKELDPRYNWRMVQGFNDAVVVAHWCAWGKEHIRKFGGLHDLAKKKTLPRNRSKV